MGGNQEVPKSQPGPEWTLCQPPLPPFGAPPGPGWAPDGGLVSPSSTAQQRQPLGGLGPPGAPALSLSSPSTARETRWGRCRCPPLAARPGSSLPAQAPPWGLGPSPEGPRQYPTLTLCPLTPVSVPHPGRSQSGFPGSVSRRGAADLWFLGRAASPGFRPGPGVPPRPARQLLWDPGPRPPPTTVAPVSTPPPPGLPPAPAPRLRCSRPPAGPPSRDTSGACFRTPLPGWKPSVAPSHLWRKDRATGLSSLSCKMGLLGAPSAPTEPLGEGVGGEAPDGLGG